MEWNQPSVILSLIALFVSVASLSWNIYNKISSDSKRLKITAYFSKSRTEGKFYEGCVAVTNIGAKPITIKNIEVIQKHPRQKILAFYRDYKNEIKNRPIQIGEERVIVIYDTEQHSYYDKEKNGFKKVRVVVNDTQDKAYRTKWFIQNTDTKENFALQLESGEWMHIKK